MKNFKKLTIVLLTIIFVGCSNDSENLNNKEQVNLKNYSLTSPKGIKIANNEQDLLNKLGVTLNKSNNEISIEEIQYFEGENHSYTAVSAYVNSEFNSVFLINEIPEGKIILQDKHSLRIVDKGNSTIIDGEILNFEQKNDFSIEPGTGVGRCFNGDCCKWEEVVEGSEFNCGCPSPATSIIITTSDGCKAEIL